VRLLFDDLFWLHGCLAPMKWTAFANIRAHDQHRVFRACDVDDFVSASLGPERCGLIIGERTDERVTRKIAESLPWATLIANDCDEPPEWWTGPWIGSIRRGPSVQPGDVLSVSPGSPVVRFLHRRASRANVLFVTARCNCLCLMCSQPPIEENDDWRFEELLAQIELIDRQVPELTITGGEPTLLGEKLGQLIARCKEHLPNTALHVLSNGRLLADGVLATRLARIQHHDLVWGIPLNAEVARVHDEIMGAPGAFAETMLGIHHLLRAGHKVEIRVILQAGNIDRLPEIARYIFWNMPNVVHVTFMGLEPIGLARKNAAKIRIDVASHVGSLREALGFLESRGIVASLYNIPLCLVDRDLWRFCRKSISDWKSAYLAACAGCGAKTECCGFFDSVTPEWVSTRVARIVSMDGAA